MAVNTVLMIKATKKEIKEHQNLMMRAKKKAERMDRIILGFNFLLEKNLIEIELPTLSVCRDQIGSTPKEIESWMKNAYIYCRLKKGLTAGPDLLFLDLESNQFIGRFDGKKAMIA